MEEEIKKRPEEGGLHFLEQMNQEQIRHDMLEAGTHRHPSLNPHLDIAPEVAAALAAGKPVVALESTLISHGMPYPQNVETALRVEAAVRACGLFRPAVYEMNEALSRMSGSGPDPYPRTVGEYLAKFGGSGKAGTVHCVSCPSDGEGVAGRYAEEVARAGEDSRRGITGMDSRDAVSAARLRADFYFGGIDSCLTEAVLGRDSVLVFDKVYAPLVKERAERIRSFGADVGLEGDI